MSSRYLRSEWKGIHPSERVDEPCGENGTHHDPTPLHGIRFAISQMSRSWRSRIKEGFCLDLGERYVNRILSHDGG